MVFQSKSDRSVDQLLRWQEVRPIVGLSRSYIHQLISKGLFPKPVKLVSGGRASAWRLSEINQWVDEREVDPEAL